MIIRYLDPQGNTIMIHEVYTQSGDQMLEKKNRKASQQNVENIQVWLVVGGGRSTQADTLNTLCKPGVHFMLNFLVHVILQLGDETLNPI